VNVQLIEKDGQPVFAVIPYDEYQALLSKTRVYQEYPELDKVITAVDAGEETFPLEFVEKLIETDSKLREWRKYRRVTQVELAKTASLSQAAIASIESGKRIPQMDTAKKLARALKCDIDDLFGWPSRCITIPTCGPARILGRETG
jgi:DNA-binding XRE family transcriptional regulator